MEFYVQRQVFIQDTFKFATIIFCESTEKSSNRVLKAEIKDNINEKFLSSSF